MTFAKTIHSARTMTTAKIQRSSLRGSATGAAPLATAAFGSGCAVSSEDSA